MDPTWFAGEGWPAVGVAVACFLVAAGILLWVRLFGERRYDPPVAMDRVRWAAVTPVIFGLGWLVRAFSGTGGFLVVSALALVVSLTFVARARLRRS